MTPRIAIVAARPGRAELLRRAGAAFAVALIPLFGACAGAVRSEQALEVKRADDVVWIRASDVQAGTRVVLTGAPVYVLNGQRESRRDTLFVRAPFAIGLPAGAFELTIAAQRAPAPARTLAPVAEVKFTTLDERGAIVTVRAEGPTLVLRRQVEGGSVAVSGARRVETRQASALAAR